MSLTYIAATGYSLMVESSGNQTNPWMMRLYNGNAQEVRWDGIMGWVTEPTSGWGSLEPFSPSGQLYGADSSGVLYVSSAGYATYLAYSSSNQLAEQIDDGDANPQITYTPSASDNTCSSGFAVYSGS